MSSTLLMLFACASDDPVPADSAPLPCVRPALATDIDETLTTSDEEFLAQLIDPTYTPAMRPDAQILFQEYDQRGYSLAYITARGQDITLPDGRTSAEVTQDWLDEMGFPPGPLYLSEGVGAVGDDAVAYKAEAMAGLQAEGWRFVYAYGNAESDILAFQEAGVADEDIFLVGELAGQMGVIGVPDEDAYREHFIAHMAEVPGQSASSCE